MEIKLVKILQELTESELKSLSQASKGKMDKHILTNNKIKGDKPLAALSQIGGNSATLTERNKLETQKC